MDIADARIEALSARLEKLEQRTADEAAAIRVELAELRGLDLARWQPAEIPIWPPVRPARHAPRAKAAADLSWLTGPRALSLAGGVVTLLGIVFVFVLAASRGWIDPAVRCGIGGAVSALLVGSAVFAQQRFGRLEVALAGAGTGIGGLYVTLYAASRGYHLVGSGFIWAAVAAVAALAVGLALAWSSQLLAVLGLVAVVVAPPAVEGRFTVLGLGASVVAAAAALGLGGLRNWRWLGGLAYGLSLAQTALYIGEIHRHSSNRGPLACGVFALAIAGAAAYQSRHETLNRFSAAIAAASLPFALEAVWRLVHGSDARGAALLAIAAAYTLPAVGLWLSPRTRGLAELLGAFALIAVALATAAYLSGEWLLLAWTLEALTLLALALALRQSRYQVAALAFMALAATHLFIFETPLSHLFKERPNPAQHITGLLLLVGALAAAALLLRGRDLLFDRLDLAAITSSALLGLYAASLAVLDAAQRLGGDGLHASFQRGETCVSALWALVALALLAPGLVRRINVLRDGGLCLLGLALVKLFLFDLSQLSSLTRAASFLAVGVALLAGGFLIQRLARNSVPPSGTPHPS
jgi:uncharacterized membrane protein